MSEQWRPIAGYEGLYEVSDTGLVRGVDRTDSSGKRRRGQLLKPRIDPRWGHHSAELCRGGQSFTTNVGRLVLMAFVGPCPPEMECCHNDGIPANNHVSNLRWDTHSANVIDCIKHGTHPGASKVQCDAGHDFDEANTIFRSGRRDCRKCVNDRKASGSKRGMPPPQHGTTWAYRVYGCRCDLCRGAKRAEYDRGRAASREKKSLQARAFDQSHPQTAQ